MIRAAKARIAHRATAGDRDTHPNPTGPGRVLSRYLDRRLSRRSGIAAAAALLLASRAGDTRAADATATVVGTPELTLRPCPSHDCDAIGTVPLGSTVALTDDTTGGFTWVAHEGIEGYAPTLFLASDPRYVPYLIEGSAGCQQVALNFNIGIGEVPATGILDVLAAEGVPATMFPMGWWAEQHPSILTRMVEEGYPIGSHGYDSIELPLRPDADVVADLHAAAAIEHATGAPVGRILTPYAAAIDDRVRAIVAAEGFLPVGWKVPANDYGPDATAEDVYARVVENIYDGAVVELHLDGPASAESTGVALPWIIDTLRREGYHFVTISEMVLGCH